MHPRPNSGSLLEVRRLAKTYTRRSSLTGRRTEVPALRGVDLELTTGQWLAIVGASGSGKSTLARCIAGLEAPDSGDILLEGGVLERGVPPHRRVQMIFQDPGASLNPRFTVAEALAEPLSIRGKSSGNLDSLLNQVGLSADVLARGTSQLSGGQKARLALARALAALDDPNPCILILDESLSSLDSPLRSQIIQLLRTLQQHRPLSYILIAHDLGLAWELASDVVVLHEGRVVDRGAPAELLRNASHPHTRELLEATLTLEENA